MGEARRGVPRGPCSTETRRKISDALRGRTFSTEHRAKLIVANRGSKNPSWSSTGYGERGGRAWIRIVSGRAYRARVVWVQAHGPIPTGHVIHHINEDTFDDTLENLQAMTRGAHTRLHKAH